MSHVKNPLRKMYVIKKWNTRVRVQKVEEDGRHDGHTCMWRVHMSMGICAWDRIRLHGFRG